MRSALCCVMYDITLLLFISGKGLFFSCPSVILCLNVYHCFLNYASTCFLDYIGNVVFSSGSDVKKS